ncbi:MAG TPA: flagellar biosynthesis protein FliQ [Solirubrobacteraceae bacterium]|jgi:flagellar biosynthetic protein FliQ|nr:flagellar biosynthesis protein FliQ [Solirubrobacteraceae bacterium]
MSRDAALSYGIQALMLGLKICLPLLGVGLVVGLIISIFQSVTQIQEMTLTFIPKLLALAVVLLVAGPWMLDQVVTYTHDLYASIPQAASH